MSIFRSSYLLIGLFIGVITLFLVSYPIFNATDLSVLLMWDAISFFLVFIVPVMFYVTTFQKQVSETKQFFEYKISLLNDMFIISGSLASTIGISLILEFLHIPPPPGVIPEAALGATFAVSMITIAYMLIFVLAFKVLLYFAKSYIEFDDKDLLLNLSTRIRLQSILSLFLGVLLFLYAVLLALGFSTHGGIIKFYFSDYNIFSMDLCIIIIAVAIYPKSQGLMNLIRLMYSFMFYNFEASKESIKSDLLYIRNLKKILGGIGVIIITVTPINVLALGANPALSLSADSGITFFGGFAVASKLFTVILLILLSVYVIEGNLVQRLRIQHGELPLNDGLFSFKFVLLPMVIWYVVAMAVGIYAIST